MTGAASAACVLLDGLYERLGQRLCHLERGRIRRVQDEGEREIALLPIVHEVSRPLPRDLYLTPGLLLDVLEVRALWTEQLAARLVRAA